MTLRVECGHAVPTIEIGGGLLWSETLTAAGTTTRTAPASTPDRAVVFTLVPEANGWVSIGASPDPSNVALRRRMLAGVPRSFVAPEGAAVAWLPG